MIKFCNRCKTRYPYDEECPNGCQNLSEKRRQKYYDTHKRNKERSKFYQSKSWIAIRKQTLSQYNSLCLWSWAIDKKIVQATTVHHIVELKDNKNLGLVLSNLIPLSAKAHGYIHKLYREGQMTKLQRELIMIKKQWESIMGEGV